MESKVAALRITASDPQGTECFIFTRPKDGKFHSLRTHSCQGTQWGYCLPTGYSCRLERFGLLVLGKHRRQHYDRDKWPSSARTYDGKIRWSSWSISWYVLVLLLMRTHKHSIPKTVRDWLSCGELSISKWQSKENSQWKAKKGEDGVYKGPEVSNDDRGCHSSN